MITAGDDYPLHQTPEPVAYAGSDRNFYDRYFFNGYSADGSLFFAAAMGFYPQLGIVDGAFCLTVDGMQHNLRASRHLHGDRMELSVGPISIEIVKPLNELRLQVAGNDSSIRADLTFTARHLPIEEPRFTRRNGTRMLMDVTRMTQNGAWSGTIMKDGQEIVVDGNAVLGTRDRSWGIRPIGASETQPPIGGSLAQFYWLWAPCNFDEHACFAHTNDDAGGEPWNRRSVIAPLTGEMQEADNQPVSTQYRAGTRRASQAKFSLGENRSLTVTPTGLVFYMNGLGYTHPQWGHGMDHGGDAFAYDNIDLASVDDNNPANLHIQALSNAVLNDGETEHSGIGVLEQMFVGPHAPSGFAEAWDMAK